MSQLCVHVIKWTAMSCHIGFNIFYINFKKAYTLIWGVSLCDSCLIYLVYFVKSMLKQRCVIGLWTSTLRYNRCIILLLFVQHHTPTYIKITVMNIVLRLSPSPDENCFYNHERPHPPLFVYFCMICIKYSVLLCFVCMRIWHRRLKVAALLIKHDHMYVILWAGEYLLLIN